jgi:hypothetical protein
MTFALFEEIDGRSGRALSALLRMVETGSFSAAGPLAGGGHGKSLGYDETFIDETSLLAVFRALSSSISATLILRVCAHCEPRS